MTGIGTAGTPLVPRCARSTRCISPMAKSPSRSGGCEEHNPTLALMGAGTHPFVLFARGTSPNLSPQAMLPRVRCSARRETRMSAEPNTALVRRYFEECVNEVNGPGRERALAIVDELM